MTEQGFRRSSILMESHLIFPAKDSSSRDKPMMRLFIFTVLSFGEARPRIQGKIGNNLGLRNGAALTEYYEPHKPFSPLLILCRFVRRGASGIAIHAMAVSSP